MAGFWAAQPAGRVVHLVGADPEAIALALEPLPDDAPAVVTCHPIPGSGTPRVVASVLAELDRLARALYPAWLPDADGLDGPQGARVPAVRALALRRGSGTAAFGPFLADLAERSLDDRPPATGRFAAEVRAAGLARVIADSFRRPHTALLVPIAEAAAEGGAAAEGAEQRLVAACEWLAHHGGFVVWLAGAGPVAADRLPSVRVHLPERVAELARVSQAEAAQPAEPAGAGGYGAAPGVWCPPLAGRPAPGSRAEQALEAALAGAPWAEGRMWNRTWRADPLAEEIRVDLMWEPERCAVEIDGHEHRGRLHYQDDRRRDVQLQLAGFAVLRFTNAQVADDLGAVLSHIEQIVTIRRQGKD